MKRLIPEDLVANIMVEARKSEGTWSFSFIKKLQEDLKYFDHKKLDKFVNLLLTEVENDKYDNNIKFKLAQLLSTLRSFFLPGIIVSINSQSKRILQIVDNIQPGKLDECTKRMFLNLIQTNCIQPPSNRVKSSSVQPITRSGIFNGFDSTPQFPI